MTIVSKADCEVEGWHIDSMDKREEQPSRIHAIPPSVLFSEQTRSDQIFSRVQGSIHFTHSIVIDVLNIDSREWSDTSRFAQEISFDVQ